MARLVPDSGAPPGMELQQRSPGPFHYLINEQAKSLVALQELQNEVGALLEFRDLVMDTFPHLRTKMASAVNSTATSPPSNIPIPLASSLTTRREWEPGIRVRRKLPQKDLDISVTSLPRRPKTVTSSQQQPKSGETSSAGSSAVQDSGFSTETSSSKEPLHSSVQRVSSPKEAAVHSQSGSSTLDEAEDELWNLLDVIHRKGTKLREEVEVLQEKLTVGEAEKARKAQEEARIFDGVVRKTSLGESGEGLAFIGGELDDEGVKERRLQDFKTGGSMRCVLEGEKEKFRADDSRPEDEVRELKFERDYLLDKVSEMEAETLATRAKTSQLKTELYHLVAAKRDLEEQLRTAVTQKCELNTRIHDLHLQFVGKTSASSSTATSLSRPTLLAPSPKKPASQVGPSLIRPPSAAHSSLRPSSVFAPVQPARLAPLPSPSSRTPLSNNTVLNVRLGTLDGIVSQPSRLPQGVVPDPRKISAILNEFSPVELQRHLLTTTVENQGLQQRLDKSSTAQSDLAEQLERVRDENDDLRFQLEEKSIELEGTKARVRVLERLHLKSHPLTLSCAAPEDVPPPLSLTDVKDASSVQDLSSADASSTTTTAATAATSSCSPKKRPSKIPLGKSYTAPKPPVGKNKEGKSKESSITGKSSSGRSSSSLFQKNSLNSGRSKDSLNGHKKSDSLSGRKSCESLSAGRLNSMASNASNGKKDSLGSKKDSSFSSASGRKSSLHRQLSARRSQGGNVNRSNGSVIDQADAANPKTVFSELVDKEEVESSKKRHSSPDSFDSSRIPIYKSALERSALNLTPPWNNSSSSEYFDSITNSTGTSNLLNGSASVFNNMPQLHSCSDSREEYFDSSNKHEGLADYDSLELGIPSTGGKLILSRNVWVTAESNDQDT